MPDPHPAIRTRNQRVKDDKALTAPTSCQSPSPAPVFQLVLRPFPTTSSSLTTSRDDNRFITCEEDEILEILDAWYGRENDSICNVERGGGRSYNAPGECRRDAKWVIDGRCNGQRGCSLGFG
ncbi:unnamed protein product, partial [Oikopleura dioica]